MTKLNPNSTPTPVLCVVVEVDREHFYLQEKDGDSIVHSFPADLQDDPRFLFKRSPDFEHLQVGDEIEVGYDFENYAKGPIRWLKEVA